MKQLINFIYAVAYTPMPQLLSRLRLTIVRFANVRRAKYFGLDKPEPAIKEVCLTGFVPRLVENVFSKDTVVLDGDGWHFKFLNRSEKLGHRVRWHESSLNRGTRLWKLHLHYFDWASLLNDRQFQELVDSWIAENPPFIEDYWKDCWNSYAISIRTVSWIREALRRQGLEPGFQLRLHRSIREQLVFLRQNPETDIGGNHLIKNIKALMIAASVYADVDAQEWGRFASNLLAAELKRQILPDGFHFELSPAYHNQVFGDLLDIFSVMQDSDLKQELAACLEKMAHVTIHMEHPDGAPSLFNDGGLNMTHSPSQLLRQFEVLTGRPSPTRTGVFAFPDAGYYGHVDQQFAIIYDAGKVGPDRLPAHAHGDINSFELSAGGQRLIVDAGVFEYSAGTRRQASRSTTMHNTVTVSDLDQCHFFGSFRMGKRASVELIEAHLSDEAIRVVSSHDGYAALAGMPIHKRAIMAQNKNCVEVWDSIEGGRGQDVKSRLLLHPDIVADLMGNEILLRQRETTLARIKFSRSQIQIEPAFWWPDFGKELKTSQIVISYGEAPTTGSFRIDIEM